MMPVIFDYYQKMKRAVKLTYDSYALSRAIIKKTPRYYSQHIGPLPLSKKYSDIVSLEYHMYLAIITGSTDTNKQIIDLAIRQKEEVLSRFTFFNTYPGEKPVLGRYYYPLAVIALYFDGLLETRITSEKVLYLAESSPDEFLIQWPNRSVCNFPDNKNVYTGVCRTYFFDSESERDQFETLVLLFGKGMLTHRKLVADNTGRVGFLIGEPS